MFEPRLSSLKSVLAGDHDRLDRAFQAIATRACAGNFQQLAPEWSAFQEALFGHLEAEEKHLIPALAIDRPREANTLLDEHAHIRVELLRLGFDFDLGCWGADRVEAFATALHAHAAREERVFYPWTDRSNGSSHAERRETAPGFAAFG